jgi:hypothetical protein
MFCRKSLLAGCLDVLNVCYQAICYCKCEQLIFTFKERLGFRSPYIRFDCKRMCSSLGYLVGLKYYGLFVTSSKKRQRCVGVG